MTSNDASTRRRVISAATPRWTRSRRVEVQRCPAVPTAPKSTARTARSRSASSRTMTALLPPSSKSERPIRRATASPTARPIRQLPVAETSGRRASFAIRAPSSAPPTASENSGGCPARRQASAAIRVTATALSGVSSDGFHTTVSPHVTAMRAFQAHTATGKLNAVITPTGPSGCHCSSMRWSGRSECIAFP